MSSPITLYTLLSGAQPGWHNMATDDALLEWVRHQSNIVWIVRTYCWAVSTLSYGVHQSKASRAKSLAHVTHHPQNKTPKAWVKRPTGGRAILHGADISFSVCTNDPWGMAHNLSTSYGRLTRILDGALTRLNVSHLGSTERRHNAYTQSALCFETQTPYDIIASDGHKMAGCAQVRRKNGVLQHGAVFFEEPVSEADFLNTLQQTLEDILIGERQGVITETYDAQHTLLQQNNYRQWAKPIEATYDHELSGSIESAVTT